jgi:RecA-family ATPase
VPERRWIVTDLVPEANVTMLGGDGGVGKSLFALQLLVACALGKPWVGRGVRHCRVVGVFCEDDRDELHMRLADVLRHYGAKWADLENLRLVSRVGLDNLLLTFPDQWAPGEPTALYGRVSNLVRDHGAELLVLDSLHDFFGGNENSRPHARQFINVLRSIALQMRGGVLITAHPSLAGRNTGTGEAGSTGWSNTVRSRLYLTRPKTEENAPPDHNARTLRRMKANYAGMGDEIKLRWRDGVLWPDGPAVGVLGTIERRSAEMIFLDNLRRLVAGGTRLASSKHADTYAPKLIAKLPEAEGRSWRELEAAMWRLISAKRVTQVTIGPPSRPRTYLEPAA